MRNQVEKHKYCNEAKNDNFISSNVEVLTWSSGKNNVIFEFCQKFVDFIQNIFSSWFLSQLDCVKHDMVWRNKSLVWCLSVLNRLFQWYCLTASKGYCHQKQEKLLLVVHALIIIFDCCILTPNMF